MPVVTIFTFNDFLVSPWLIHSSELPQDQQRYLFTQTALAVAFPVRILLPEQFARSPPLFFTMSDDWHFWHIFFILIFSCYSTPTACFPHDFYLKSINNDMKSCKNIAGRCDLKTFPMLVMLPPSKKRHWSMPDSAVRFGFCTKTTFFIRIIW